MPSRYAPSTFSTGYSNTGYDAFPPLPAGPKSILKKAVAFDKETVQLTKDMGKMSIKQSERKSGKSRGPTDFDQPLTDNSTQGAPVCGNQQQGRGQSAPSQAMSGLSRITHSMLSGVKLWGVHVQNALTNITSTTIGEFKPQDMRMKANAHPKMYKLGHIIKAPWVVSSLDCRALKKEDPKAFDAFAWANTTGPICAKMRPMIVYAIFSDHLLVYPIFTSQGHGMLYKDVDLRDRSLPLYDSKAKIDRETGPYYLRAQAGYVIKGGAYVDMTMPYNVSLSAPIAILGLLTEQSWDRFDAMHSGFQSMGQKPWRKNPVLPEMPQVNRLGKALKSPIK